MWFWYFIVLPCALFGAGVTIALAWVVLKEWWEDNTTCCRRCKNRGVWNQHFCGECGEKIEKLIGEKW